MKADFFEIKKMDLTKKSEEYTLLEGTDNVYVKNIREVALSYSLLQLKPGTPSRFYAKHMNLTSLRAVALRLEKTGVGFDITTDDHWQSAIVTRRPDEGGEV